MDNDTTKWISSVFVLSIKNKVLLFAIDRAIGGCYWANNMVILKCPLYLKSLWNAVWPMLCAVSCLPCLSQQTEYMKTWTKHVTYEYNWYIANGIHKISEILNWPGLHFVFYVSYIFQKHILMCIHVNKEHTPARSVLQLMYIFI